MTTETKPRAQQKWVVDSEDNFLTNGPRQEWVMLIPRVFADDDDWYFVRSHTNRLVCGSRVFDTPQQAAEAAIKFNEDERRHLQVVNDRISEWRDRLSKQAEQEEAAVISKQ